MFTGLFALQASTLNVAVENQTISVENASHSNMGKQEVVRSSSSNVNLYSFLEEILISGQEDDEDEDDRLHEFDSLDSYSLQDDDDKSFDWRISDFKLHCDLMFRSHLIRLQQTDLRLLIEVFQI